jgi:DNA-binding NtrC family response regulator
MRKKRIFIIDDDELIVMVLTRALQEDGYEVQSESSTEDIVNKIRSWFPDVALLDVNLPGRSGIDILKELKSKGSDTQVVMLTADDTAETAVKAMKLGAADYFTKPFNIEEVKIVIQKLFEKIQLEHEVEHLRKVNSEMFEKDMIGESAAIRELRENIEKIAKAHVSSILITGENGSGKEVVARYIHRMMFGAGNAAIREPFIGVNCAALPESILESELFGYERGAFTDAKTDRKGVFELANGGTILLDEIGEMKLSLQSKLLRVLEERTIRRIGGREDMPIDVTVLATTNKNISEAVKSGEFRTDLFYRVSTFYLHMPPLRERREDVPLLARYFLSHFVSRYNKKMIKDFSPEALALMSAYDWPGNVREIKNLVERLVVLENVEEILPAHLPDWLVGKTSAQKAVSGNGFVLPEEGISLDDFEKGLLIQALDKTGHNKTLAAKLLRMSYDSFRYQIKKFGLE